MVKQVFSPHTWRCFHRGGPRQGPRGVFSTYVEVFLGKGFCPPNAQVFSTYVEVFPKESPGKQCGMGFLHIRGGVSKGKQRPLQRLLFSPHTWRCFRHSRTGEGCLWVFSTYVEVFPQVSGTPHLTVGFLHIRGGVSHSERSVCLSAKFSPHTWRCFPIAWN